MSAKPGPLWLVVNYHEDEMTFKLSDRHRLHQMLPPNRRPKYLHESRESAEMEALRLNEKHGGGRRTFIVFEAVACTETRQPFIIATPPVSVLVPMETKVIEVPARPPKRRLLRRESCTPHGCEAGGLKPSIRLP